MNGALISSEATQRAMRERAEALMVSTREELLRGDINGALEHISLACHVAALVPDPRLQVDANTRAAIVYDRARKHDLAFVAIEKADQLARTANLDRPVLIKIAANRASFLMSAGFLKRAIQALREVVETTQDSSDPLEMLSYIACSINIVYCSLITGRLRDALEWARQIELTIERTDVCLDRETRNVFDCWYASALSQTGDPDAAIRRLSALRERLKDDDLGLQIQFAISLSIAEVHSGLVDQGLTRLAKAVALAEKTGLFYSQALHAMVLVNEHLGNIADALLYVQKLEVVMTEAARGIVGIEEIDEDAENVQERARKPVAVGAVVENQPVRDSDFQEEDDRPDSSQIRMLDQRAADLRIRRFMELTQSERATVLDRIAVASALVDDETGKHCVRVQDLAYRFAKALGFEEARAQLIGAAARLHDIGKIGIPHRVLLAPRRLTPMEFEIAKKHTNIGADLLTFSDHDVVRLAKVIAHSHHERWDGSGYPKKLFEDQIPIEARITSIVDVFDVLTHRRVYKRAWGVAEARAELEFCSGTHFDPRLVEIFLRDVVPEGYVIPTDIEEKQPSILPDN